MGFGKVGNLLVFWGCEFGSHSTEPEFRSGAMVILSIDEQGGEDDKDLEGIAEKSSREGADEDGKRSRNFMGSIVDSTSNKKESC